MKGPTIYFWDMEKYGEPKNVKEAKAIIEKYGDQATEPSSVILGYIDVVIQLQDICKEDYKYGPIIEITSRSLYQSRAINKVELPDGNWSKYFTALRVCTAETPIVVFMLEHGIIVKNSRDYCPPSAKKKWDELDDEMNPRFPHTEADFRKFVTKRIMAVLPDGVIINKLKSLPDDMYSLFDFVLEFEYNGFCFFIGVGVDRDKYNNSYGLQIGIGLTIPKHLDIIKRFEFVNGSIMGSLWFILNGDVLAASYIPKKYAPKFPREVNSLEQIFTCITELKSNLMAIMDASKSPYSIDRLLNSPDSPYMPYAHSHLCAMQSLMAARFANNPDFESLVEKFGYKQYFSQFEANDDLAVTYPAFVRYLREEAQLLENI